MKKIISLLLCTTLLLGCFEELGTDNTGSIAGSVSDYAVGEPIPVVNVVLNPVNSSTVTSSTVTGTDGTFSFRDIPQGEYTIDVSKSGYKQSCKNVFVYVGETSECHLLLERMPAIVTTDRDILDFGKNYNTMSFNIVNSSYKDLEWSIEENCEWITEIKPREGTLKFGSTATIVVVIDRDKLNGGTNRANIVLCSNNGSTEVKVIAEEVEGLATVETLNAKNIEASSATIGGMLVDNGGFKVTERGVCLDTDGTPDTNDNHKYISGNETGEYWIDVDNLKTNTKYYFCAYARNENGVSYGRINEFTTVEGLPTVETLGKKNVTARTASLGGDLVDNGGYKVYERGVCWDTDGTPDTNDNHKYISGDETGEYWIDVTNLNPSTKYYFCAYARNENGVSYGKLSEFKTEGSEVRVSIKDVIDKKSNLATFVASIDDEGSPKYTECGFCYSTQREPTIYDNKEICDFNGRGTYTKTVSGLEYDTEYYVRAYAIQEGKVFYSESEVNFKTVYISAVVSLVEITDIEETTATLKGNVTNAGSPNYKERGFCWSRDSENPTIDAYHMRVDGTANGTFKYDMNGLSKSTTYHVRAYVIQGGEVKYSNEMEFTTIRKPKVITQNVTDVKSNEAWSITYSATFNGYVDDAGSPAYEERGFVYNTHSSPTVGNGTNVPVSGSGKTGTFSASVSDIQSYKTYYVRAYVKTEKGYTYGETVTFTTY